MPAVLARPSAVPGGSLADEQPLATLPRQATPLEFIASYLAAGGPAAWTAASDLVSGEQLGALVGLPQRLWDAPPHAAVVLAWKIYTYRLAQPVATAWTLAREVPLMSADNVLIRVQTEAPYITVGLRRSTSAVLPTDCAARSHDAIIVPDEAGLLSFLRQSLIDQHLAPLLASTVAVRRIGTRILWGQVAAGLAYAFADISATPGPDTALLAGALGLPGLAGVGRDGQTWRATCCRALNSPAMSVCRDCPARTRTGWQSR
jgi:hypothetical protein